jgi:hypothetical protein
MLSKSFLCEFAFVCGPYVHLLDQFEGHMSHLAVWQQFTDVSDEHTVSIFWAEHKAKHAAARCLLHENRTLHSCHCEKLISHK